MDVVVFIALFVLVAVFLFSLFVLIIMCRWKNYNNQLLKESLRFSKLRQENLDVISQLGPHISQTLCRNQWVEDVSGILEHCTYVLKLCHELTQYMATIPLNKLTPQLSHLICRVTLRVTPSFDSLLNSLDSENVDIRLSEARVASLINVCWALATPFLILDHHETIITLIDKMDYHHRILQEALKHFEDCLNLTSEMSSNLLNSNDEAPADPSTS